MGYVFLLLATLSWSFVGVLVKVASAMLDSSTITFLRFALGVVFLGAFLLFRSGKLPVRFDLTWLWIGAAGKGCNYFFENLGLSLGYSYGNILVVPIQTIVLLLISVLWFKDRLTVRGWAAAALCLAGVLCISWNGRPLSGLFGDGGSFITLLFAISAFGSAFHVLGQKMLTSKMEAGEMNLSMFVLSSAIMALPLPFQFEMTGELAIGPVAALLALGLITGMSFYWFSRALRLVSFPIAIIVSNTSVLFGILWSGVIRHDPITVYLVAGALVFAGGLVILNWPSRNPAVRSSGKGASA
ncbi:DMT family transporter [Paenibacillus ginsengarvi]|uniref:DMT family transporter n=1 Tax=Paenibacillus ginsengarvi TaxID=400777 RepID=A0A3B0BEX4_9BACL|nr:DMT family transporter [Paenibacillus ginsengarvi]RKN71250.1 DMT family transporter [Paenibacillus ginsengarvi]